MDLQLRACLILITVSSFVSAGIAWSCLPCTCGHDNRYDGVFVSCNKLNQSSLPSTLPNTTTTLIIDKDPSKSIHWSVFGQFANLKYLSNFILYDVHKLNTLRKDIYQTSDMNAFFTHHNLKEYLFFDNFFPHTLHELYLDNTNFNFSDEFSTLPNLTLLSFSETSGLGLCYIFHLTRDTFRPFIHLQSLNLSGCVISYIQEGAFALMTTLHTLDLSLISSSDHFLRNATMNLSQNVEVIRCVYHRSILYTSDLSFLGKTSIREVYIDADAWARLQVNAQIYFPKGFQVLSIKHFIFSTPGMFIRFLHYTFNTNITYKKLDLSGTVIPPIRYLHPVTYTVNADKFICSKCSFLQLFTENVTINTQVFIARDSDNEVLHVRLKNTKHVDLANNKIRELTSNFIQHNNSLSFLNLANNKLAKFIGQMDKAGIYSRLRSLEVLDISSNSINFVPTYFFDVSVNLRLINISDNILQNFDVHFDHLAHLETLDLSNNSLYDLAPRAMSAIENLPSVSVHLYGNPLVCSCGELPFLRWMQKHRHKFPKLASITCRLSSGQRDSFDHLDDIVQRGEEECKSYVVEIVLPVLFLICLAGAVTVYLIYRNRWKIRYLYHVGRRSYRRLNSQVEAEDSYQYDGFVSYADDDRRFVIDLMMPELEDKHGLKLCIHHRDFLPGEVIATNIVSAIQNSRKTLVVLSPSFLRSSWCEYEYNMARMEGVSRRQEIMLVVLYKSVEMGDLPKDMTIAFRRNSYLEYNEDVFGNEVFWNNVVESIKTNRQRE